jgi:NAD(P)-dependent dehydrogenase (short-subunit alcohol dehydrogenase family)
LGPAKLIELLIESDVLLANAKLVVMSSRAGSTSERGLLKHHMPGGDLIYRASKAALNNLIKNISFTYKNSDLTIVAVHPGWVRTKSGGKNADLDIMESASQIAKILSTLDKKNSGSFINFDGSQIPW